MVTVLGFDIGGANTKAAFIHTEGDTVLQFKCAVEYFPFWKRKTAELNTLLSELQNRLLSSDKLDCVAVTMTAELSDAFKTKREGINAILDAASVALAGLPLMVLDVEAGLRSVDFARAEPLLVASANWAATGWMVAQRVSNCVVVDVGSTSTSIVPILDGKVAAAGKNDLQKLGNGELVYTGCLRTNVAAIVNSVPVQGIITRVSPELFAQSGDVHLVLGNITEEQYTAETADERGKTLSESFARLARVVCADVEMLSEQDLLQLAHHVYRSQIEQIAEALTQVYSRLGPKAKTEIPAVVTGLGKEFLARRAAEQAGVAKIVDLTEFFPEGAALASPATGVAYMAATKIEGRTLKWTQ